MNTSESPEQSAEAIGQRLAQLRIRAAFSQAELAAKLNISTKGYQNYERGIRGLPARLLIGLHDTLGADPLWILTGEDAGAFQWTTDAVDAVKNAVQIVEAALTETGTELEPELKAELVAHLARYGITDSQAVDTFLSLRGRDTK